VASVTRNGLGRAEKWTSVSPCIEGTTAFSRIKNITTLRGMGQAGGVF
jgi:hypothetical protein